MRSFTSRSLVWTVILVSVALQIVTELRIAGHVGVFPSAVMAYAAFFINIACSGLGFRTPERPWWIGNVVLSIVTLTMIGAPTIPNALWLAGRILLARLLA
ncbi:MAG: hypothetical protein J0G28_04700 [Afipia sp.]|nr:hypothetical protein [Afipia sp.]OJW64039.1 MAG: hypothetical protein BGO65_05375 [Afipia sp. 64-13]